MLENMVLIGQAEGRKCCEMEVVEYFRPQGSFVDRHL